MSNATRRIRISVLLAGTLLASMAQADSSSVTYTYDPVGRVMTALYNNGTCLVYTYDAVGNRTVQTLQSGSALTPTWGSGTLGCFKWTPS